MNRREAALVEDLSRTVQRVLLDSIEHIDGNLDGDRAALAVEAARVPMAPARLAAAHPAPARAEARALYERCLAHYRTQVRAGQADAGLDDVGAAVAHFVAANIRALHGVVVTPQMLLQLERQLGGVVRVSSAWATASARERQVYFEQMAILAVLIGESAAQAVLQGPAALANVQRAARGYLKQLLGLNADHLTLDDQGLALRVSLEADDPEPAPQA